MQEQTSNETNNAITSFEQAFALAVEYHQSGNLEQAEKIYRSILSVMPNEINTLHFLGIALHQIGNTDEGIELIEQSIALDPTPQSHRYSNLSRVLLEANRFDEAIHIFQRVLELEPTSADAHNNLGVLLKAQKRFDEALIALKKAIDLNPQHANAYYNLGDIFALQGLNRDCVTHYRKTLELQPSHVGAKKKLGFAYYALGEFDQAAEIYRQWLAMEPDNPIARHHLAACTNEAVPTRAEDAYIELTFNEFAESFDAKLERLNYQAPHLITKALQRECGLGNKQFSILDAGCGTGLCGALISNYAKQLIGVDLSQGMLNKAKQLNVYDTLIKDELTRYLKSQPRAFDIIISADTLVYFGKLEEVISAAHDALRTNGYLFFTVESLNDTTAQPQGYCINPDGRYSHSETYLEKVLENSGLALISLEPTTLRYEGGNPVQGFIVSCRPIA